MNRLASWDQNPSLVHLRQALRDALLDRLAPITSTYLGRANDSEWATRDALRDRLDAIIAAAHDRAIAGVAGLVGDARDALRDVVGTESGRWEHPIGHCTLNTECAAGHVERVLRKLDAALAAMPPRSEEP